MIGKLTPTGGIARPLGQWSALNVLGLEDGCVYLMAAPDLPPGTKAGDIVRFEVSGPRAVNVAKLEQRR